jgi:hypothetical protein
MSVPARRAEVSTGKTETKSDGGKVTSGAYSRFGSEADGAVNRWGCLGERLRDFPS